MLNRVQLLLLVTQEDVTEIQVSNFCFLEDRGHVCCNRNLAAMSTIGRQLTEDVYHESSTSV
jgi:hypothetical protein